MDDIHRSNHYRRSVNFWQIVLCVCGGVLIALVLFPPLISADAASAARDSTFGLGHGAGVSERSITWLEESGSLMAPRPSITPTATETLIITDTPTETVTDTPTATTTATDTTTPTTTPSQTASPTATVTPTPTTTYTATTTSTITRTPTITSTPTLTRTPTATGTITPLPTLRVIVTPSEAQVNANFTFTITVGNGGTAPFTDSIVSDSFPTYLTVEGVTVSPAEHGIVTRLTHSFTVSLGNVYPNETITITASVKVNSSLTRTETASNVVTMTYDSWRSMTASVNFKVVTTTLPGTGDLPLNWRQRAAWESLQGHWLWGGLGVGLIMVGTWKNKSKRIATWFGIIGLVLLVVGLIGGCTSSTDDALPGNQELPQSTIASAGNTQMPLQPASSFSTPEVFPILTLPDYPIPTPVISVMPAEGEAEPDTSPVVRIVIPALFVDTEVKYVPFDGFTWLIGGLRSEVAWLGNTSWPGLGSNTALAGHVTVAGYGDGPFRNLEQLPNGEVVILYTEDNIYTYQVRESRVTDAEDLSVTSATENAQVTLITCVDWDDASESYINRLIVFGDLVRVEPVIRGSAP